MLKDKWIFKMKNLLIFLRRWHNTYKFLPYILIQKGIKWAIQQGRIWINMCFQWFVGLFPLKSGGVLPLISKSARLGWSWNFHPVYFFFRFTSTPEIFKFHYISVKFTQKMEFPHNLKVLPSHKFFPVLPFKSLLLQIIFLSRIKAATFALFLLKPGFFSSSYTVRVFCLLCLFCTKNCRERVLVFLLKMVHGNFRDNLNQDILSTFPGRYPCLTQVSNSLFCYFKFKKEKKEINQREWFIKKIMKNVHYFEKH